MGIKMDISDIQGNMEEMYSRLNTAVGVLAEQGAVKMQSSAKKNAPWTDRTGAARGRLSGTASPIPKGWRIKLAHGVSYGIYLELAHERRFAIIQQTVDRVGYGEIMPAFNRFMDRLR